MRRSARHWAGPWASYKLRNDAIVPLICPTCQNVFAGKESMPATTMLLCMGLFSMFWLEARAASALQSESVACRAVARRLSGRPSPFQSVFAFASLKLRRTPRFALQAPSGCATRSPKGEAWWPGRTRTCNQTVMSGLDQQNALVFSGFFTSIICDLLRSFTFMRDPTGTPTGPEEQRRTADSVI
jgi:hypothetical protein